MSFDRSSAVDDGPDSRQPSDQPAVQPPDAPDSGELAHARLPTRDERIAAYWETRIAADKEYAAREDRGESQDDSATRQAGSPLPGDSSPNKETAAPENTGDTPESVSTETDALRQRVADLEAGNADRDSQLATRDKKLAEQDQVIAELRSERTEQDKRIAQLETDLGRIAASVSELQRHRTGQQPSADIAERAGGNQAERARSQHKRRVPTDTVNNVISIAAGGVITDLAYHLRDLPPETAGIGASGVALGAGLIAVWRERRKAKDDADHRPKG
jgi:uncharacterized coiled-coil protein SlyX